MQNDYYKYILYHCLMNQKIKNHEQRKAAIIEAAKTQPQEACNVAKEYENLVLNLKNIPSCTEYQNSLLSNIQSHKAQVYERRNSINFTSKNSF